MKFKIIKILAWTLTVSLMVAIFCFSAQDATESGEASGGITDAILRLFPKFRELPAYKQNGYASTLDHYVRKTAHFTLYLVFGMLMYVSFGSFKKISRLRWLYSWFACAAYSITDELHQYFVPGRSCEVRDMCIDSLGALCGTAAVILLIRFYCLQRKKKKYLNVYSKTSAER